LDRQRSFDSTRTASQIRSLVSCVVNRNSCRSIMLRQEKLNFKAISTIKLNSKHLLRLRMALSRRKKQVVPARSRSTTSRVGVKDSKRPSNQLAGNRIANELASCSESSELAKRSPGPGAGYAPLPAISSVTCKLAALGSRALAPPD
jgi:hypothetical protein